MAISKCLLFINQHLLNLYAQYCAGIWGQRGVIKSPGPQEGPNNRILLGIFSWNGC